MIRVGDAGSTFDVDAESVLIRARESLLERDDESGRTGGAGFKSQRQLMSGGVCEASAFAVYGYQVTGIAFPLGNYHNAAPEGGVEAEFIHVDDYLGGHRLVDRGRLPGGRPLEYRVPATPAGSPRPNAPTAAGHRAVTASFQRIASPAMPGRSAWSCTVMVSNDNESAVFHWD